MSTFALQLSEFAKRAGRNADLVVQKVATDVLRRVVLRSPVDTGRFRGNWQTTISAPAAGSVAIEDKSGNVAISKGQQALVSFQCGPDIFITNNLPYGRRLEYEGWSKQAPAGMVRITVSEYANIVARAVGEVQS